PSGPSWGASSAPSVASATWSSRARPGRRPWRSPSALPGPWRPRRSPRRSREPTPAHLWRRGRALGRRARGGRGERAATPSRRPRGGIRRALPRGRGRDGARPHGALLGHGVRRGPLESASALPPAEAGARRVPGRAVRPRHPGGLPGVSSARRRGRRRGGCTGALLHRTPDVGLGPAARSLARVRATARRDPPVRGSVLPGTRRGSDVRRASAARPPAGAPEFLQGAATPAALAGAVLPLLDRDGDLARRQRQGLALVRERLGPPGAAQRVADLAAELVG